MRKQIFLGCILIAVMMLTSCATWFSGSKNMVTLYMEPAAKAEFPAKIYIDGDYVGDHHEGLPLPEYELRCKKHRFKIVAEGYEVWEKDLIVLRGAPHRFVALLKEKQVK